MVINRIRQHVRAHNWFAVAVDLAIVIAGVFLGVQATRWNDRRIEHDQSVSYRSRLIRELDFNAGQYERQRAYYEQVRGHALATRAALRGERGQSGRDFLIHAYQSTQIDITPAKRFIYDEMVSAGLGARIGTENEQAQVSDYYTNASGAEATYGSIPKYRALMRTLIPQEAQAEIRDKCGDIRLRQNGLIIGSRLPESCDAILDDAVVAEGVARIQRETGLQDELNHYLAWINEKSGSLQRLRDQSRTLRRLLIEED